MPVNKVSAPIDIAVSGMQAESLRMRIVASNIANANTTKTPSGEPYRRQELTLVKPKGDQVTGVKVLRVSPDLATPFKTIHDPGHPDANKDGFVMMPNVDLPQEMMNLVLASRAYQANASVMKRYQEIGDVALELLK